jgi:flagellar biosynthesis protein FliR
VARSEDLAPTPPFAGRARVPRAVWHTLGLILAVLLAYMIWRGYQAPDFVLDFAAFRLC